MFVWHKGGVVVEHSKNGHRSRLRKNYIFNGTEGMADTNLLELYLSTIIPRKDVKPLAYDLLNEFGSLENVFSASAEELKKIKGIGEKTVFVISLFEEIAKITCTTPGDFLFTTPYQRLENGKFLFEDVDKEQSAFVVIDNQDRVSGVYRYDGYLGSKAGDKEFITKIVLQTNASQCVFYHFIGDKEIQFTDLDKQYFAEIKRSLMPLNISILDWIAISNSDCMAML